MSYKLNKTDGSLLVDLVDGLVDTDTTNLTLIGRNYTGFGEFLNENFIKLLENFANTAAPSNPVKGQLWYDTSESRLKIYNGEQFVVAGSPFVQQDQPQMIAGDLWINNLTNQFYFFDGSDLQLVGPIYTAQQGQSGFEVVDVLDSQGRTRRVLKLWIAGQLVSVFSNLTFTPAAGNEISEIPGEIKKGINLADTANFKFYGTAQSAEALTTQSGGTRSASQFLPNDADGTTVGSLTVQNPNGIILGLAQNHSIKTVGNSVVAENQLLDHDYKIRIRSSAEGDNIIDAVTVVADNKRLGVFNNSPQHTLDVSGDCRITGNLEVEGDATYLNVTNLQVEDKNIELLGTDNSSSLLSKSSLDDAGIIVKSSDGDIKLTYQNANQSWTSTENINLASNKKYKIGGTDVLDVTTLGSSVVNSSLTSVGNLTTLSVGDFSFANNTVTVSGSGLEISSADTITINSQRVTGVLLPTTSTDVANKDYVDTSISSEPVVLSLDITGLDDSDIALVIEDLIPASSKQEDTTATVHTTEYSGSVTDVNIASATNKSFIAVDSAGTQNESVVQDINFVPAAGSVFLSVARGLKRFKVTSGQWTFVQNLSSSV